MKQEDITLSAADGHNIFVRHFKPARKKVVGVIHISHGMAEHSGRYINTAKQLCSSGFVVYAHDHRGHGHSVDRGPNGHYADKNGWELVKSDLDQVQQYINHKHAPLPVFLLGHSMGSFISMAYLADYQPSLTGLILSGSNYDNALKYIALKPVIKLEKLRIGNIGRSPLIEHLTFGSFNSMLSNPSTDFDWLSRDVDEVQRYIDDELSGFFCTNQLWDDLTDGLITISSMNCLRKIPSHMPIYLFAGEKDPVGEYGKGVNRLTTKLINSGHTDVSCKLYPNARHEMLNELNSEQAVNELADWILARIKRLK